MRAKADRRAALRPVGAASYFGTASPCASPTRIVGETIFYKSLDGRNRGFANKHSRPKLRLCGKAKGSRHKSPESCSSLALFPGALSSLDPFITSSQRVLDLWRICGVFVQAYKATSPGPAVHGTQTPPSREPPPGPGWFPGTLLSQKTQCGTTLSAYSS